ncbi:MAG: hypothetical protein HKM02_03925 [Pseudomonadales bacterium]|nr:hypothetical protein [Pseudomonadales bacterium]
MWSRKIIIHLSVCTLLSASCQAYAVEAITSGFASLIGGAVVSGSPGSGVMAASGGTPGTVDPILNNGHCPCAVGNWPNVGLYDKRFSLSPESRAGIQENLMWNNGLSLTAEATVRAAPHEYGDGSVDWFYAGYSLGPNWTLQAGRKRLPLFMYSDFIDIGYDYAWMRPPGDLYGWQIDHYNGANLLYSNTIMYDIALTWNTWTGAEHDHNNKMLQLMYYNSSPGDASNGQPIDEYWYNMIGSYLDFSRDWWDVRLVYMQNDVTRTQVGIGYIHQGDHQKFQGASVNLDPGNWVVRSEFNEFLRPTDQDYYHSSLLGIGYHIGDFLPMLTYSNFHEDNIPSPAYAESHFTRTASVRWDFRKNMDLKLQYDDMRDDSHWPFLGNTRTITVGIDTVF